MQYFPGTACSQLNVIALICSTMPDLYSNRHFLNYCRFVNIFPGFRRFVRKNGENLTSLKNRSIVIYF